MSHSKTNLPSESTTSDRTVTETAVPGGWTESSVSLAGRTFNIVLPAQPDAFLEALAELPVEQHDDHDVYWAQLWQAASPTAERILNSEWQPGLNALEFGCGLGLAGLAALVKGMQVTFSDYVPFAVQTALENARRHGFSNAQGEVIDWRVPPSKKWPFVFACDVLYNKQMHEALIHFIDHVLTAEGQCWIGDAGRFHANNFLQLAQSKGFQVHLENEQGQKLAEPHYGKFQMFILNRRK